jgi:hypothetical protein
MTPTEKAKSSSTSIANGNEAKIWFGIAVGVAVGIGVAISRRKRSRWDTVRAIPQRVTERSGDLVEATRDLAGRAANLYDESCKLVEDAGRLWAHGRKLVGY